MKIKNSNKAEAIAAFNAAEDAWQAELTREFGREAHIARYEKRGRGAFNDDLGRTFLAREKARLHFEAVYGEKIY